MAAGLLTLGDNEIEARLGRALGRGDRAHDLDGERPRRLHLIDIAARITPEEGDDRHLALKRNDEAIIDWKVQHKIGPEGPVSERARLIEKRSELLRRAPRTGQMADTTSIRHGRRETGRRCVTNRCLEDRPLDAQAFKGRMDLHKAVPWRKDKKLGNASYRSTTEKGDLEDEGHRSTFGQLSDAQ
jgi:hypothetical protein